MTTSREHDARYWQHRDYLSMLPFSQFKFKNPCKKCIVRPSCSKACDNYYKYTDLKIMLYQRLNIIKNFFLMILGILCNLFYFGLYSLSLLTIALIAAILSGAIILAALYTCNEIWLLWWRIIERFSS
jgi:hypothetical protein